MIRTMICVALFVLVATKGFTQCRYQFEISGKKCSVEEAALNDIFGRAFNELQSSGNTKEKYFEMWAASFRVYKNLACRGTYSWDVYHDKATNLKYRGDVSKEELGLDKDGKSAKGNVNQEKNFASRMAMLNNVMMNAITKYCKSN